MARYFDRTDPEIRKFYGEWAVIPPAEVLERRAENVEGLLPESDPDALMPRAHANA
jgi:hypothetical protein